MNLNFNSPGVMWECQWQQEVSPVSPVEDARVRAWTDGEKKGLSELRAGGGRDARKCWMNPIFQVNGLWVESRGWAH